MPDSSASGCDQYGSAGSGKLSVFDRITGATVATLGSGHHVIAFSGGGFSGFAASNSEQYELRVLVNYDVEKKAVAWRTAGAYRTHPALGNGVIYAATATQFDAIGETDGKVLWSWALPATDTGFHHNVVVTDSLVFVSGDNAVDAIDLKTHLPVWQYPKGGNLAISGGGILYITVGSRSSTGELVAIKLMKAGQSSKTPTPGRRFCQQLKFFASGQGVYAAKILHGYSNIQILDPVFHQSGRICYPENADHIGRVLESLRFLNLFTGTHAFANPAPVAFRDRQSRLGCVSVIYRSVVCQALHC